MASVVDEALWASTMFPSASKRMAPTPPGPTNASSDVTSAMSVGGGFSELDT